ncbi:MAG: S9 family peptidase [Thermoanaerobaculia bacterium]
MTTRCPVLALLMILVAQPMVGTSSDDLELLVTRMARVGGCWSPSFSPDGGRLAFVSDLNGVPQVWTVATTGGWPDLVTGLDDQVGSVVWSPDGSALAFTVAPGGGMNQQIYLISPDGSDLRRVTDGGRDNNWLSGWSHDGRRLSLASNRSGPESMDAYVFDLEDRKLHLLARNPGISWISDLSRDGHRAVLYRMQSRSDDNLFLLDVESGRERLLTPHDPPGSFDGGLFSPAGDTVYLTTNLDRDLTAFGRIRLGDDGEPGSTEILAARGDAEIQSFAITDDGTTAVLLWNVAGRSELELFDLVSRTRTPGPELSAELVGGLTFSRDGKSLAMILSGAAAPSDVWILDLASGRLRQITHSPHPGVDLDTLVRPELVRYPAHDGLELSGWLYRPPGVSGPAPYVLSFHGGPEGQERPRFRGVYQGLAATGIGVFAPNVRGSSGFGKRFVNLDNGGLRFDGIKDIEATVRYLVDGGVGDPRRLGIMGGSYGGYMTMAGLAWYPELFAAGANLFGVVNFETFFAQTEPWMAAISTVEYGDPATQADLLRKLSPIHKVDQVRAPTIVLHGANDTNVPVVEAEQVVDSLRRRGVPVEYVLFADEGHGFRKTVNRIRSTVAVVAWFEKHLEAAGD